jgi:hypothetical protein
MKKWSISLTFAASLLALAAFALPMSAGAATGPYCPSGQTGTPPNCVTPPPPPPPTCSAGQVGTYPNCVTPAINVNEITTQANSSTVAFKVNAPGTVKVSGKGVAATTVSVTPGKVKVKVKLTAAAKEELKAKGKLTLKVKVTYTPKGGTPVTETVKVTFKSEPGKGHKGHK